MRNKFLVAFYMACVSLVCAQDFPIQHIPTAAELAGPGLGVTNGQLVVTNASAGGGGDVYAASNNVYTASNAFSNGLKTTQVELLDPSSLGTVFSNALTSAVTSNNGFYTDNNTLTWFNATNSTYTVKWSGGSLSGEFGWTNSASFQAGEYFARIRCVTSRGPGTVAGVSLRIVSAAGVVLASSGSSNNPIGQIISCGYTGTQARGVDILVSGSLGQSYSLDFNDFYLTNSAVYDIASPGRVDVLAPNGMTASGVTLQSGTVNAAQGAFSTSLTLGGSNVMTSAGGGGAVTGDLATVLAVGKHSGGGSMVIGAGYTNVATGNSAEELLMVYQGASQPHTNWHFPVQYAASFSGTNGTGNGIRINSASDDPTVGAEVVLCRSRGTLANPTPAQVGDETGEYDWQFMTSNGLGQAAAIKVEAAPGFSSSGSASDQPANMKFQLYPDNIGSPTNILILKSDGRVIVGGTTNNLCHLEVLAPTEFSAAVRTPTNVNVGLFLGEAGYNRYEILGRWGHASRSFGVYNNDTSGFIFEVPNNTNVWNFFAGRMTNISQVVITGDAGALSVGGYAVPLFRTTTSNLSWSAINAGASATQLITVAGAKVGDGVTITPSTPQPNAVKFSASILASNVVTINAFNVDLLAAAAPSNGNWIAEVRSY